MVDINTSKITHLWPTPQSRPVDKAGSKKQSSQNQQQNKKQQQDNSDSNDDDTGHTIDEYA